jgi:hypothetical protein
VAVSADGAGEVKDDKEDNHSDDGCSDEQAPHATSLRLVAIQPAPAAAAV